MTLRDVSHGMYGAWRLARLDRTAMLWFDRSIGGVRRSFWAALIAYPGFLVLVSVSTAPERLASSGLFHILLVESIRYVVGWTAFPLIMLPFCRWFGREAQAFDFIIAFNWGQVLQTALALLAEGLIHSNLLSEGASTVVGAVTDLALLAYEWFIARVALEAGGVVATAVVLLDLVLTAMLLRIAESLY